MFYVYVGLHLGNAML